MIMIIRNLNLIHSLTLTVEWSLAIVQYKWNSFQLVFKLSSTCQMYTTYYIFLILSILHRIPPTQSVTCSQYTTLHQELFLLMIVWMKYIDTFLFYMRSLYLVLDFLLDIRKFYKQTISKLEIRSRICNSEKPWCVCFCVAGSWCAGNNAKHSRLCIKISL